MLGLTFFGEESEQVKERVYYHELHEAEPIMLAPYLLLAATSLLLGFAAPQLEHAIVHAIQEHGLETNRGVNQMVPITSIAAIAIGAAPAFLVYIRKALAPPQGGFIEYLRRLLLRRLYINSFYYRVFVNSTIKLGYLVRMVDGALDKTYSVYLVGLVMQLVSIVRGAELLVDSALYRLSGAVASVAETVRKVHKGVLSYNAVLWLVGGLLIVLLAILLSVGW
jgi:NADH:ubiquinone oxidoreductase subunit 5 (subunit L)/multisubunit Na+/H+ antiporter MnhA subunit